MESPIKIFIANDHVLLRDGIEKTITENLPNTKFVGRAATFAELLDKIRSADADILLTDDNMPEGKIEITVLKIKTHFPDLKIIINTMYETPPSFEIIKTYIDGVLHFTDTPEKYVEVIKKLFP